MAHETYGGYSRQMHDLYVGEYVTIRPKYADPGIIKSYITEIYWDSSLGCYSFNERDRSDPEYTHSGQLYIPIGSPCLYLLTIRRGWVRTIVVSQLGQSKTMRGLITSLHNIAGPAFTPISAPIAFLKMHADMEVSVGELTKTDRMYDAYLGILHETLQSAFARIALPPTSATGPSIVPLPTRHGM
jgi:hypothetical protein